MNNILILIPSVHLRISLCVKTCNICVFAFDRIVTVPLTQDCIFTIIYGSAHLEPLITGPVRHSYQALTSSTASRTSAVRDLHDREL